MGWRRFVISVSAAQRRAEREQDRARHRAQAEADREKRQLETLRMKALAEKARGKPGAWTEEYEGRIAALAHAKQGRAAARERVAHDDAQRSVVLAARLRGQAESRRRAARVVLLIFGGLVGLFLLLLAFGGIVATFAPDVGAPRPKSSATAPVKRK